MHLSRRQTSNSLIHFCRSWSGRPSSDTSRSIFGATVASGQTTACVCCGTVPCVSVKTARFPNFGKLKKANAKVSARPCINTPHDCTNGSSASLQCHLHHNQQTCSCIGCHLFHLHLAAKIAKYNTSAFLCAWPLWPLSNLGQQYNH